MAELTDERLAEIRERVAIGLWDAAEDCALLLAEVDWLRTELALEHNGLVRQYDKRERYEKAIREALEAASLCWSEWGTRAETVREILETALGAGDG